MLAMTSPLLALSEDSREAASLNKAMHLRSAARPAVDRHPLGVENSTNSENLI
jgi:hypothetical protein